MKINYTEYFLFCSKVSREINIEIQNTNYRNEINPGALQFVKAASIHSKLALFLLSKTLLRWSDVVALNLSQAAKDGKFVIYQKKTGNQMIRAFKIYNPDLKALLMSINSLTDIQNYQTVRSEIKRLRISLLRNKQVDFKAVTHLFRHLEASFQSDKGLPRARVGWMLGHSTPNATPSYIHGDTFSDLFYNF